MTQEDNPKGSPPLSPEDRDFLYVSPQQNTGANPEFVKAQYEEHWGKRIAATKKKLDSGESLAHLLARLRHPMHLATGYNRVAAAPAYEFLKGHHTKITDKSPFSKLGVSDGFYTAVPNFDPLYAISLLAQRHKNIVELGAGPGWNLFDISIFLGKSASQKSLFGLEYTDAGMEMMKVINEREKLPLSVHQFDYTAPDISMIPDDGPTLIFSHHSIEQVEDISPKLYDQIMSRRQPMTLVHAEPIGWQRFPELVAARMTDDLDVWRKITADRKGTVNDGKAPANNAALNSWRVGYNRNALAMILGLTASSRTKLVHKLFDFTQANNNNAVNPTTYLEIDISPA